MIRFAVMAVAGVATAGFAGWWTPPTSVIACQDRVDYAISVMLDRQDGYDIGHPMAKIKAVDEENMLMMTAIVNLAYLRPIEETTRQRVESVMEFASDISYACEITW